MVSQNESIPFDLSVEAYVLLGRAPHLKLLEIPGSDDWAAASNALKAVGMDHMAKNGITRLSGGEKQLVHVARALAQNPEILLLDEPCSHLDLINSRQMLYLMKTISQARRTVVFTTHDPNAAAAIADQIILLKKGTIVAQGTPAETLTEKLLTRTYGGPVAVMKTTRGPRVLAI
jgi:iron complex transport system ATP-binding protein